MGISLEKGQKVSLDKIAPGIKAGFIGLGWDINDSDTGTSFDLDASIFLLGADEKLISDQHFIFYNNLVSPDEHGSIKHMGDNLTGAGEGDDEVIIVDFRKVPENIHRITITVTIHKADERKQNFGQVENAFVRVVDVETQNEVLRYDLNEDFSVETALIMAEIYRRNGEWRVNAVGKGYEGGLAALLNRYQ
ncbi:MAG: TerD family protein [Synechococcaceae cyanobacterium RL_1_2]|nr:TerD family protein [Synechococcaceae cyanobacterium RL_1_2]